MTQEEIIKALNENSELLTGVIPVILESDKGKEIIENKANAIYQQKINEEVSKIHSQYDEDAFAIIGEKPKVLEDGKKQKTYDFLKEKLKELADLRKQKDSLSKDAKVKELQEQIEKLKQEGGGKHWEQTFNSEKQKWLQKQKELEEQAKEYQTKLLEFQKRTDIQNGLSSLKFDESIPKPAREALINAVMQELITRSKIDNGKVIYLDENGNVINDAEYKPMKAGEILKAKLKDILKDENAGGGGGAHVDIKGSIETIVEGNDKKERLKLDPTQFKTRSEFLQVVSESLAKAGIEKSDRKWVELSDEAYSRYEVSKLPR